MVKLDVLPFVGTRLKSEFVLTCARAFVICNAMPKITTLHARFLAGMIFMSSSCTNEP
jgi:hypothetical protein